MARAARSGSGHRGVRAAGGRYTPAMIRRLAVFACLAIVLGIPFALRPPASREHGRDVPRLVIVTPHISQIQIEFGGGFERWHERVHGERVVVDWRGPMGTTEILKQLEAQYQAGVAAGRIDVSDPAHPKAPPGTFPYDLMFGGGSFDHGRVKRGITLGAPKRPDSTGGGVASAQAPAPASMPMSVPGGFSRETLDAWYAENAVGAERLYDPDQHWYGTALSSFGIVFNRDLYREMGLPEPASFEDLTRPELLGRVALADPRQSGSVATTLDSILSYYGWDRGWRLLREICGNARYFTNTAPKPPMDVSQGDAAAGLAIDFYGRSQAQAVVAPGQDPLSSRVGYVDPAGSVYIDADPVSILLGGPQPRLARRFVEFCLTEEGQALWQFPARASPRAKSNPVGESGEPMGPMRYELRRMPVRRVMYATHKAAMIDQVDPFEIAGTTKPKGWRPSIGVLMGAFGIDTAEECREAWAALCRARADPSFPPDALRAMEEAYYAFPDYAPPGAEPVPVTEATFARIPWRDKGAMAKASIAFTRFFHERYRRVVEIERGARQR